MSSARIATIANASPFCEARLSMKKLKVAIQLDLSEPGLYLARPAAQLRSIRAVSITHFDRALLRGALIKVRLHHDPQQLAALGPQHPLDLVQRRVHRLRTGEVVLQPRARAHAARATRRQMQLPEEKYSYELRRLVAEESAKSSFDEVVELIGKRTGAVVPKRQVEELVVRAAQDFDLFYRDRLRVAETTNHLMVLSFDGKGIAMRHEDLRDATRIKAAADRAQRTRTRLASGEKPNAKRMAEVAAVYTLEPWPRTLEDVLHGLRTKATDAARPRPEGKRVWASVEHSPQRVIDDAFDEAVRRDPDRQRRWVVLVDSNHDQLRRITRAAHRVGVAITVVLDVVHVLEYLWRAAYAFEPAGTDAAEKWVEDRFHALLSGHSAAQLRTSLRGMIKRHALDARQAQPVEKCIKYLTDNSARLHYDRALADGLPIATGVIEGACRYLVQDRMGRTGARWSLAGAEAVLRLRALRASADFEDYWLFHLAKEHERTHQSRYADGVVPNPLPPSRPNLRLVK